MLQDLVTTQQPEIIATYTRNPAILRMIQHVADDIYPLTDDTELRSLAASMPHASAHDAIYHMNRYGESGLFVGDDPADSSLRHDLPALKQQFSELTCVRNALVVTARVRQRDAV